MKLRITVLLLLASLTLGGCAIFDEAFCSSCRSQYSASSSLVEFLYPDGSEPPAENSIPELKLPLRVGLAFLPPRKGARVEGLEAARRDELLERIRQRFLSRDFVGDIVIVPDYYLGGNGGFDSLEGVKRLHRLDIIALVSYDQVLYEDDNDWTPGYLTIVGAYFVKGSRHDVTTLVDLAVLDPQSESILLRAGGSDTRHGTTTLVDQPREARESRMKSFSAATDELIERFDVSLKRFEEDVKTGKANVKVTHRNQGSGGGGSLDWLLLLVASPLVMATIIRRRIAFA